MEDAAMDNGGQRVDGLDKGITEAGDLGLNLCAAVMNRLTDDLVLARGIARELRGMAGKCSAEQLLEIQGRAPWLLGG